ncbi:AAA family ATPase [Falsibacillus pallidus]|uniref:AAA family ATPase n=1 Tax=Falsibacillus pallidus TaxID=493781 RepID=UPI003D96AC14
MIENKLLIISEDEAMKDQLRLILSEYKKVDAIQYEDLKTEIDRMAPDIVFLVQPKDDSSVEAVQFIQSLNPMTVVVFISLTQDFNLLRGVTRAGASDFFVFPDEMTLLNSKLDSIIQSAVDRKKSAEEIAASSQSFTRGRGQIYSFYSGKGGSGRTLIASTFAQTLKLESTAQVLLIDFNLQFGGVETYLSIESNRSLADLTPVINELNESHIRNVSERENHSKLEVLLSPKDAEVAESLPDEFISRLLRTCRRSYDFVIVDLPVHMNEATYTALEESDKIYYVLNLDTPSLQVLKQVEQLFKRLGVEMDERFELIVNGIGKDNELNVGDIKNFLSLPIEAKLNRDSKGLQPLINKGEPLRKEANEKKITQFAKDIRKWVLSKLG